MQRDYHARRAALAGENAASLAETTDAVRGALGNHAGDVGEEFLEVLRAHGIGTPESLVAPSPEEVVAAADRLGYPVVLKVISPDALHKSDVGGVKVGLRDPKAVGEAFEAIRISLLRHLPGARFEGVRVVQMAEEGHDMFVGASLDAAFGPVVFFGYGGVFVEIFKDVDNLLCPAVTTLKVRAWVKKAKHSRPDLIGREAC
jgi:acyl-CoA synthetase (NDP forming)